MRHFFLFIIYGLIMLSLCLPAETVKLPGIGLLKELPLVLVGDFTEHEDIASPALPEVTKDGMIFFFDAKHKQLFKTHLKQPNLIGICREGEGPKEYSLIVYDILIHNGYIYLIDLKGKLLCFDINGGYQWEERTGSSFTKIVGKRGDTFYLQGASTTGKDSRFIGIFEWHRGKKYHLLKKLPLVYARIDAVIYGKVQKGGGMIDLAKPVFSIYDNFLISSASTQYTFDFLDLKGNPGKRVILEAPEPELNDSLKNFPPAKNKKVYSIMDIFCDPPDIIIVSNYFRDGKPRIDFFNSEGQLKKSFLMPFKVDNRKYRVKMSNHFLVYSNYEDSGFRIYRIKNSEK